MDRIKELALQIEELQAEVNKRLEIMRRALLIEAGVISPPVLKEFISRTGKRAKLKY